MSLRHEKLKVFSKDQVARHNTPTDLWMIIHGRVYDVTPFVTNHPGGPEVLFEYAGDDCTESFDEVGHSQDSIDMLQPLCQGVIATERVIQTSHHDLNASVGESKYWKEKVRNRRYKRKRFKLRDTEYAIMLGILAVVAAIGYIYLLSKRDSF